MEIILKKAAVVAKTATISVNKGCTRVVP